MIRQTLSTLCALLCSTATHAQQASAAPHSLSAGLYYSEGSYGAPLETLIRYIPVSYGYQGESWGMQITVPYVEIEGLGNALVNVGGVTRARPGNQLVDALGLGDVVASVTYQFPALTDFGLFMDVVLETKIPTADEAEGLGTGELDYSAQLDFFQTLGSGTAFGTLGYRRRGKTPVFAGLSDSAFAEAGFNFPFSDSVNGGLIYSYGGPASDFSAELHELLPFISWNLGSRWSLMTYGVWGFTVDSPDFAVGSQLTFRW